MRLSVKKATANSVSRRLQKYLDMTNILQYPEEEFARFDFLVCGPYLSPLFPLITFVVKMMYLQIICQHEALQILETIKQKALQLACKQVKYGSTEVFHIFPMELKTCTDKL